MTAPSPINDETNLVTFTILTNGSEISGTYQVRSIEVTKNLNRIPSARFSISDGSPATADFEISDTDDFKPGNEIEIKAGYHSDETTIFKGIIIKHGVRIGENCSPELNVECRDEAVKMTVGRKNATYGDGKTTTTDGDLMKQVIENAGLHASVGGTSEKLKEVIQFYSTDWDFLLTRAQRNSMVVIVDAGAVDVNEPKVSESAVLSLTYGTDILDFQADMDAQTQLSSVTAAGWDPATQAVVTGSSTNPTVNSQGNIDSSTLAGVLSVSDFTLQTNAPLEAADLTAWASAQLQRSWLNRITGHAKFQGNALAAPGATIDVSGVGTRFNGTIYVTGVTHEVANGNWTSDVTFGLDYASFSETPNIVAPLTAGLLPGVNGLQIGTVKQIYEDPDQATRIQVEIAILQAESSLVWARMATFYATNSAGTVFYPEVGDEVILGFVNDDPRYPVILGSMYSKTNVPPVDPDEENTIKAFTTKGGNAITLTDKENEQSVAISTPQKNNVIFSDKEKSIVITDQNSNKVTMSEEGISIEDKNGNSMAMSSSGVTIKSASNLTIEASGNVTIKATGNLDAQATGNATVKGMQATLQADMAAKVTGQQAELSGALNAKISGAMVNIN
ncbi:MAG: type VI secretion system tip protein VgrG [Salibacteraceae bacterium]